MKEKKSNQRIVLQRGRETCRKERRETVRKRERSMGRGEIRVSDSEGVRREKVKGREKKVRNLTIREGRRQKIMFPTTTDENNIYRRCNV